MCKKIEKFILEKSRFGHFKNVQNGSWAKRICKIFYTLYITLQTSRRQIGQCFFLSTTSNFWPHVDHFWGFFCYPKMDNAFYPFFKKSTFQ